MGMYLCWRPPAFVSIRLIISLHKKSCRLFCVSVSVSFFLPSSLPSTTCAFFCLTRSLHLLLPFCRVQIYSLLNSLFSLYFSLSVSLIHIHTHPHEHWPTRSHCLFSFSILSYNSFFSPLICRSCFKIYESLSPFISLLKHNNVHTTP